MPFPLPSPEDLVRQQEALMEMSLRGYAEAQGLTVTPEAIARAVRSPVGMVSGILRAQAQLLYSAHLHLRWWGDQYMPDTAEAENLVRHAGIWLDINRRPATKAIGIVTFTGAPGTVIPLNLELLGSLGKLYVTTASDAIGAGGSVALTVEAVEAGSASNAAGPLPLSLVSPLPGLATQAGTVDANGLAGGAPVESDADLLERVLERIREPAHGGAAFDYPVWVRNRFAASHVRTLPNWVGLGTVGVCVAMGTKAEPLAPTPAEQAAILEYLGEMDSQTGVRPVTAEVVIVPVVLLPVPIELSLTPDELKVRAAVDAARQAFFAREARIGERVPRSRLSEAISSANGEYSHNLILPATDVVPGDTELPVPGPITWVVP